VGDEVRIGYSFWGFLGPGVVDTPDGGRSHRAALIDGLLDRGRQVVFLQIDRDLTEAGTDLTGHYRWDGGLPDLDALMLEWRWPIQGRNTSPCGRPGHTCDLHRQIELVTHYTSRVGVPTVVWDKDRQLPHDDPLRTWPNVAVCEPALQPSPGAVSLLFPVADHILDAADPAALARLPRELALAYVGNQYDRDAPFDGFFAPAAASVPHLVAGKWTDTSRWPHVTFGGRVPFLAVEDIHRNALATVLLLPDRYATVGHMTQRLFEAVLAGCIPITPSTIVCAEQFTPQILHADDAAGVMAILGWLTSIATTPTHAELLADCLRHLDLFRVSRQLAVLDQILPTGGRP
jgi:hypothetical protein